MVNLLYGLFDYRMENHKKELFQDLLVQSSNADNFTSILLNDVMLILQFNKSYGAILGSVAYANIERILLIRTFGYFLGIQNEPDHEHSVEGGKL